MKEALKNARHENFALLIAGGKDASAAYREAGYSARGNVAEVNASRLLRNAQNGTASAVRKRIDHLIAETRLVLKNAANKTREEKLKRLEELAWSKEVRASDAIAAIRVHNDMTGDNSPTKIINEDGPERCIAAARERALTIASPFSRLANRK